MNLIDKIQKKHTEVLDFYSSEKLTERERNLLRTEMAFLLELKSDAEALNIDLVSDCVFSNIDDDGFTLSIHKTEEGAKMDRDKRRDKGEDLESYQVILFE
tara:strand:+ start:53 stop:355 length:303 start_codon:yes stop_codon:yes gene_type:complete